MEICDLGRSSNQLLTSLRLTAEIVQLIRVSFVSYIYIF